MLFRSEIITPNNDGKNDVWRIINADLYPNAVLQIFNRWGRRVYETKDVFGEPWDGKSNGKPLPTDSYHYILDLKDGTKPRTGVITLIR